MASLRRPPLSSRHRDSNETAFDPRSYTKPLTPHVPPYIIPTSASSHSSHDLSVAKNSLAQDFYPAQDVSPQEAYPAHAAPIVPQGVNMPVPWDYGMGHPHGCHTGITTPHRTTPSSNTVPHSGYHSHPGYPSSLLSEFAADSLDGMLASTQPSSGYIATPVAVSQSLQMPAQAAATPLALRKRGRPAKLAIDGVQEETWQVERNRRTKVRGAFDELCHAVPPLNDFLPLNYKPMKVIVGAGNRGSQPFILNETIKYINALKDARNQQDAAFAAQGDFVQLLWMEIVRLNSALMDYDVPCRSPPSLLGAMPSQAGRLLTVTRRNEQSNEDQE